MITRITEVTPSPKSTSSLFVEKRLPLDSHEDRKDLEALLAAKKANGNARGIPLSKIKEALLKQES